MYCTYKYCKCTVHTCIVCFTVKKDSSVSNMADRLLFNSHPLPYTDSSKSTSMVHCQADASDFKGQFSLIMFMYTCTVFGFLVFTQNEGTESDWMYLSYIILARHRALLLALPLHAFHFVYSDDDLNIMKVK